MLTKDNIYNKAMELKKNFYHEKQSTSCFSVCDHLFINHHSKSFFFTTKETGEFACELLKSRFEA